MSKRTNLIIIAVLAVLFVGVLYLIFRGGSEKKEVNPAFTAYISSYTSGIISCDESIIIRLREPIPGINMEEPLSDDLFDFSPNIEGEAYWADSRTIEFRPKERLPAGTYFEAEFELGDLMEVPVDLETFEFSFQTLKQSLSVITDGLQVYNNDDLKWQKLIGKVVLGDVAPNADVESILSAVQNGKALKLSWDHSGNPKIHTFIVDSIRRTNDKGEVILQWDGANISSEEKGELVVEIPPLGDFKVQDAKVMEETDQYVSVFFSDPVSTTQDLEGLIYIEGYSNSRIERNGNEIKIFPSKRIEGSVKIMVNEGVRNVLNYQLKGSFSKIITFTSIKPNVEIIGEGVILPSTNGLIFPFKAVNLSAVNVKIIKVFPDNILQFFQVNQYDGTNELSRVGRIVYKGEVLLRSKKAIDYGRYNTFALDLSKMIEVDPGSIYRVSISFEKSQSLYPCEKEEDEGDVEYLLEDEDDKEFDGPDHYYYYDDYYYDYDYDYNEKENPCDPSYYRRKKVVRNVLASDLGIIAKMGSTRELLVAVSDLRTTESISGVRIRVLNYQGQEMASAQTGGDGTVNIKLDKAPFFIEATNGNQKGYLRIDNGESLSQSMFDVDGQTNQKGVKGFIYGERGVWRPGDSLFVSFILEDKNNAIPPTHPIVFELFTPENQLFERKVKSRSVNGTYDFRTKTDVESPTGNWYARVKVGGSTFGKTLRIETVKPNRLKINIDFHDEILRSGSPSIGDLEVKWLHGATAGGLKADIEVNYSKATTSFKAFSGYCFDDPSKDFETEETIVFNGSLNSEGKATVIPTLEIGDGAPGMVNANFKIRAFENGGEFSVDRFSIKYSPYRSYVGLKVPEGKGWEGALFSNEDNLIPIALVDEYGKPLSRDNVKIEVYDVRWSWWWERRNHYDLSHFVQNKGSYLRHQGKVDVVDGKAMYLLNLKGEYWGRKLIRVVDPVSGHSAGVMAYFTYQGWWSNSSDGPGGAEMLTFNTDKKIYNVGEEVSVSLPDASKGRAFVTIESGSRVIEHRWVDLSNGNQFSFKAKPDMAPNVYVHISLLQPHNQMNNDRPMRMYGIQPIKIEDPNTKLKPVIEMAKELEPEKMVDIKVSEANGKKMTYTLAVVDEGLLDLTRFKTPDPWSYFYSREALGVKTWDMYKYVMGAFKGEFSSLLELGGDEFLNNKEGEKANRFKPVVKFFGPFELKAGDKQTIRFKMPNYVGSVKTMVVAQQDGAYGNTEKATPVRKSLMVLATLPRVVGPTEKVKLPATVFAMDYKIKTVDVELKTNNLFQIEGSSIRKLNFTKTGEQVVNFDLNVSESIGVGKAKVIAKSAGYVAEYEIEIDVRNPNPRVTKVLEGIIEPGKSWTGAFESVGMQGTNEGKLEISSIPSLNLEKRLKYLIQYPHGCIEQTTSSVFPQLYLDKLMDLNVEKRAEIEFNVAEGIKHLRHQFQIMNGSFPYWPGGSNSSEWGTTYAGHFIIEAKKKGYDIPINMLESWISYQKSAADNWKVGSGSDYNYYGGQLEQVYRLYTLALAGSPALGAMNRMRELPNLSNTTKWMLAATYHLSGKKEVSEMLIADAKIEVKEYKELSYTFGSSLRDKAMILEAMIVMDKRLEAKSLLMEICKSLSSESWYSTQTTSYSLLSVSKYIGGGSASSDLSFTYSFSGRTEEITSEKPVSVQNLGIKAKEGGIAKVSNKTQGTLFVKLVSSGIPPIGDQSSEESNMSMQINYFDLKGNRLNPSILKQGIDFIAEVFVHNPGTKGNYNEMAITQIFPSGWEIRNLRMDGIESTHMRDKPTYEDIRDDRVYSYFDLKPNETKRFRVLLHASYLGKFYLPTVYCEAMYDNEINAHQAGKWVEVIP